MLPGVELMNCPNLAVPNEVMHHVVRVESAYNPYAIGVVGGRLARQPRNLPEALSTARMLEEKGYNFSVGLAQVNRYNLAKYGLDSYERAFETCSNLQAGSRILAECYQRSSGDWGKSFSCYYSGNFTTGFKHGYVQKVYASIRQAGAASQGKPIEVIDRPSRRAVPVERHTSRSQARELVAARAASAATVMGAEPAPLPAPAAPVMSGAPGATSGQEPVHVSLVSTTSGQAPSVESNFLSPVPVPSAVSPDQAFVF